MFDVSDDDTIDDSTFLCEASHIPNGEPVAVHVRAWNRSVAVYKVNDEFFASDDLCTHGDAKLSEGMLDGHRIICPYHLGEFDVRTGEAVLAPCALPVRVYTVTLKDKALVISRTNPTSKSVGQ